MNVIKILTRDDFNDYKTLVTSTQDEFTQDAHSSQTLTDDFMLDLLSKSSNRCLVFGNYKDDQLVGTATLEQIQFIGKEHKSLIKYNFIKNNDKHINKSLITYIIDYAKKLNCESLLTSIISSNISAKVFYNNLGFDILGFEKNAIKIQDAYFDVHWLYYDLIT